MSACFDDNDDDWESRARAELARQAALFSDVDTVEIVSVAASSSGWIAPDVVKRDEPSAPMPTEAVRTETTGPVHSDAAQFPPLVLPLSTTTATAAYGRKRNRCASPIDEVQNFVGARQANQLPPPPEWVTRASDGDVGAPPPLKKVRSNSLLTTIGGGGAAAAATLAPSHRVGAATVGLVSEQPPAPPPLPPPPPFDPASAPPDPLAQLRSYFASVDVVDMPSTAKRTWVYVDPAPAPGVVDAHLRAAHPLVAKNYDDYVAELVAAGLVSPSRPQPLAASLDRPQHFMLLFDTPVA